jgi:pyruvate/2-oxoglutarate dehydrogenase complex dihydrolipoamide dehydrogenase (E3) component
MTVEATTPPHELHPDLCIIGAGAGGLTVASAAAAFGVNVVLVEKGRMGGATLNNGALPAQALLAAGEHAHAARTGARFGAKSARFSVDYAAVRAHVRDVIKAVEPLDAPARLSGLGVRVIEGVARFVDRETVAANGVAIKARRFVIATGSLPALPAIPGLADVPHLTGETVFDLEDCPRHLIVIGADNVGLELAQAFRRLGAEVTVLLTGEPLADYDPECAALLIDALMREGIVLRSGVTIAQIRRALARVHVEIESETGAEVIDGTHLLIAAGRRPNVSALDLDKAGIRYAPGGIVVDRRLLTSNKHVYAIGDVTDAPKYTHVAYHHAGLVIRHALFRTPIDTETHAVPLATFTDPELAQVGLTEEEARAASFPIRVLRWPYRENERAQANGSVRGHIKIVTDKNGGILGATVAGPQAAENIALWSLAVSQTMNIEALAGVIIPYPTYAEVGKRAAMTYFTRGLTSPLVRRIIGWLRRFG